ncbi:hypothetical protein [Polaromonas aquatica]|uniref:hypothetical protein n=1 Tax=Polaromonas aquatica TaxID=332657 RepID=UPI003D657F84
MDKLYKPHFLRQVKHAMAFRFPEFSTHAVPRDHPMREIFSSALIYRIAVSARAAAWLVWEPAPGVERRFNVRLGWSPALDRLPQHHGHDARIYSLTGPSPEFEAASLELEQIEGKPAIGGITIASPWDQLLKVKASAPARLQQELQNKAFSEALALSDEDRATAVSQAIDNACTRIEAQLPAFIERLRGLA